MLNRGDNLFDVSARFKEDKKHFRKIIELYQKGVGQDDAFSMLKLGICYSRGQGVDMDHKKAFNLYKKSAVKGNIRAQLLTAKGYYDGIGVKQNLKKATKWFIRESIHNKELLSVSHSSCCFCKDVESKYQTLKIKSKVIHKRFEQLNSTNAGGTTFYKAKKRFTSKHK